MPKIGIEFHIPLNLLLRDDGTKEKLIAIAYYRGEGASFAGPARDALEEFTRTWRSRLTPAEQKRYDEILDTVVTTAKMKKAIKSNS